jgi:polysaccharide deacetylase 2 family uncharacterized protein YibQ
MTKAPIRDEDDSHEKKTPEKTYRPKRPRNLVLMLGLVFVLAALAMGGIVTALLSTREDPSTILMPVHTVKSLSEDQPVPSAAPPVMATPESVPDNNAESEEPVQKEVPLQMTPVDPEKPLEKPLLDKEPIAPQSMIPERKPALVVAKIAPQIVPQITPKIVPVKGAPQIAIVIDDMGPGMANSRRAVMNLPAAVTLSYLPYAEHLQQQTQEAYERGHELIVHMPMEPDNLKGNNPGPDALLTSLPTEENVRRFKKNLDQFQTYIGVNNHMGSRMTASETAMRPIMQVLKERGLWFLDSRTIGNSVAGKLAGEMGVPYAERDVFLDNTMSYNAVMKQLQQLEAVAQKKGYALAIGHPHDVTLDALQHWVPEAKARGFQFVPLSTIIAERFPKAAVPRYAQMKKSDAEKHAAVASLTQNN